MPVFSEPSPSRRAPRTRGLCACALLAAGAAQAGDYALESSAFGFASAPSSGGDYAVLTATLGDTAAAAPASAGDYGVASGFAARIGNPELYLFAGYAGTTVTLAPVTHGTASDAAAIALLLANLRDPVSVQAPAGFEVSDTLASGYADELTLDPEDYPGGELILYVRAKATAPAGTPTGNLAAASVAAPTASLELIGDIARAPQTITFTLASASVPRSTGTLSLGGLTSAPGLGVAYASSNTSIATVSGSTLTLVGAGVVTITAVQPGGANHLAATPVARVLIVSGPVAAADFIEKPANGAQVKFLAATLLANDTRVLPDGSITTGGLSLLGVTSGAGNTASLGGGRVFFTGNPAASAETFTYTLSDGVSTATGLVTVTTADARPFALQLIAVGQATFDGTSTTMTNAFLGVPGQAYEIEYKGELTDSAWISAGTVNTGATGSFVVTITASGDRRTDWNTSIFFRARRGL